MKLTILAIPEDVNLNSIIVQLVMRLSVFRVTLQEIELCQMKRPVFVQKGLWSAQMILEFVNLANGLTMDAQLVIDKIIVCLAMLRSFSKKQLKLTLMLRVGVSKDIIRSSQKHISLKLFVLYVLRNIKIVINVIHGLVQLVMKDTLRMT